MKIIDIIEIFVSCFKNMFAFCRFFAKDTER